MERTGEKKIRVNKRVLDPASSICSKGKRMDERRSMVQHPLFIVRNIFRGENVKHEEGRIPMDEREDNYHLPNIFSSSRSKTFLSLSFSSFPPLSLSLIKIHLVVLFLYKEMPAEYRHSSLCSSVVVTTLSSIIIVSHF